jgi:hypothetical protein
MADSQRWQKRILRLGLILGIGALLLAVSCVVMAWHILNNIDGQSITDFQDVNSALSVTNSVAATLIRFAIGGGLAIHW